MVLLLYFTAGKYYVILNHVCVTHECDGRTNGQTNRRRIDGQTDINASLRRVAKKNKS